MNDFVTPTPKIGADQKFRRTSKITTDGTFGYDIFAVDIIFSIL